METVEKPFLRAGRVYRTRELGRWGKNAPRLAKRLVRDGTLVQLAPGLYVRPRRGRFGAAPPTDDELMRAFLGGTSFVFTGPERWNALGLGTTAVSPAPVVYNTKRTGRFQLGGRWFELRRVGFPKTPPKEWFVVDLFEHAEQAGASRAELTQALTRASARGAFDVPRLLQMAAAYGTRRTRDLFAGALSVSQ